MPAATLEKYTWPLIFGGLIVGGLGFFVDRQGAVLGMPMTVVGALAMVAGVVLIWLRSRMPP